MEKSLDRKLARIAADPSCRDFIIADAKDADMAYGLSAPGRSPEHHAGEARFRTLDEYRQLMREIVAQGLVDIMLMSASSNEVLTIRERIFDGSHITPAIRANDTTEIWLAGGEGAMAYSRRSRSARPRSTTPSAARSSAPPRNAGWGPTWDSTRSPSTTTPNWTAARWRPTRRSASRPRPRDFATSSRCLIRTPAEHPPADLARFMGDHIVRTLAGVTSRGGRCF